MSPTDWLYALALMMVIEGILPFAAPHVWRDTFRRMIDMSDSQLRLVGMVSMGAGMALLLFL
jgi:uncharacterized protein YjeT (DUF2065 family)